MKNLTQLKVKVLAILIASLFMVGINQSAFSQVGISSTTITPDPSSMLEIRSTSTGILIPRMTTTERDAIASPAAGLLIYNTTTNAFNYYNGVWTALGTGTGSGTVTSASVVSANGFSGTVADPTTTPAITITTSANGILKGNGTAISAANAGTDYVAPNGAITGSTKTKITYDVKGLVTAGADATTADIAASTNKNYVTDAQVTLLGNTSNTNSGDNSVNSLYSGLASSKQNTITTGTTSQYFRGDLSLATFPTIPAAQIQSDWTQASTGALDFIKNKPSIPTQYTDALARAALSLTTTGTSGAATYNSSTGAFNIPQYSGGGMTYPSGSGIPIVSSGTSWGTTITDASGNWNTAYTDRLKWDGGSTGLVAATGRTSLGATTVGSSLFTLTNPSAVTFPQFNADNTVSALGAAAFRTAIGAGTSSSNGTVTSVGLSTGTSGTDVNVIGSPVTGSGSITINIPDASGTARGLVTTGAQTFAGTKTFSSTIGGNITGNAVNVTGIVAPANGGTGVANNAAMTVTGVGNFAFTRTLTAATNVTFPTSGTLMANPMTTGGDLIYGGASGAPARLANGTAGQVLQSNGALAPTWTTANAGTVTAVSVASANGFAGTSGGGATPALTLSTTVTGLLKGNGTSISAATSGTDFLIPTGSAASLTNFPTLNQNTTGNAATVTTNANLTGEVTSVGNATNLTNAAVISKVLTGFTSGAGTVLATDNILQAIQKLNGNASTIPTLTGMVTSVGNATTVVTNANLTGAVTSTGNATSLGSFSSANLSGALTDKTGTGVAVFATSPNLVTPNIGAATGTSLNVSGLLTSTVAVGTAPFVVTSTTPVANLSIGGNAANVSGTVAIANGGTGQTTQQAAINALTGTQTTGTYLRSNGTNASLSGIQAADVPTLNQNTTGTAANVTGTVVGANGGTGVANTGKTITLGGNLTTSGAFATTLTVSANTNVTLPTTGTLVTTGTLINVMTIENPTTQYTPTSGAKSAIVYLLGGGGGGGVGGAPSASTNRIGPASGGGAGSLVILEIPDVTIASNYTVAVGTGGASATAGVQTTLTYNGTTTTAPGGGAGNSGTSTNGPVVIIGGAGGAIGTNGTVNGEGQNGQPGIGISTTVGISGNGGESLFGGGGIGVKTHSIGVAATGYGSGGSGGLQVTTNATRAGGAGANGVIIVYEFK